MPYYPNNYPNYPNYQQGYSFQPTPTSTNQPTSNPLQSAPIYSNQPQPTQNGVSPTQSQIIQNGGFVSVPSEEVARNWPIAPGNSVTFKDETAPYVYSKTMGFSQLDRPIFEKYRLVKEENGAVDVSEGSRSSLNTSHEEFVLKKDFDALRENFEALTKTVEQMKKRSRKREEDDE